jgi:hypothetical protein
LHFYSTDVYLIIMAAALPTHIYHTTIYGICPCKPIGEISVLLNLCLLPPTHMGVELGAVGDQYVQDGEGVWVADAQGARALAVMVPSDVDGVVRGVPADIGVDAQGLVDALASSGCSALCTRRSLLER